MIPSVLADQVRHSLEAYLKTTFPVSTPLFKDTLDQLLQGDEIFRGPWVSVGLPFVKSDRDDFFADLELATSFRPYRHQERAFDRLGGDNPRSTLVATGTGSGKTECFLYPVLDYCLKNNTSNGIKAIFIYPMNSLAVDQAGLPE